MRHLERSQVSQFRNRIISHPVTNNNYVLHPAYLSTVVYQSFQGSSSMYSFNDRIDVPLWSLCCKTFTNSAASSKLVMTGTLNSTAFRRISYPSVNASE